MFYSETILSKKGPLAKVWLAAHWEKKLSKTNIIQTNIEKSVESIVQNDHGPLALRTSGQLLLGVVKIYSRKARYLLEDCNDALQKIKMVFRPGNVDMSLATVKTTQAQAAHLVLPETLTELDLLMPDPNFNIDLDLDFDMPPSTAFVSRRQDITLRSAFEDISVDLPRGGILELEEDPLEGGVDIELDTGLEEPSIEIGRDAPSERALAEEFDITIGDLSKTFEERELPAVGLEADTFAEIRPFPQEAAEGGLETPRPGFPIAQEEDLPRPEEFDVTMGEGDAELGAAITPARRAAKKRKMVQDSVVEIPTDTITANLEDTSAITKKPRILERDPVLLNMMQKSISGGFAQDIFAPSYLNPNIRNLVNPNFLRAILEKREQRRRQSAGLPEPPFVTRRASQVAESIFEELPLLPPSEFEIPEISMAPIDQEAPLPELIEEMLPEDALYATLEPLAESVEESISTVSQQSSLVSVSTAEALSQIRGAVEDGGTASFADLASGQTRLNVSKLFFEVLLLATKDALAVEQAEAYGNINITARPNLASLPMESQQTQPIVT